jgi:hypothetical protein
LISVPLMSAQFSVRRRTRFRILGIAAVAVLLIAPGRLGAQEDTFRWVDFHSAKDQDIAVWVTRALDSEKWTAIREVGVIYDAALVVTTSRANSLASPSADTFQIWSVSLTTHAKTPLLKGVNLHWLDWMQFGDGAGQDLAVMYDDCSECASTTYFTAFHYDRSQHIWAPRWMRGGQAVPLWSNVSPEGVAVTRVYAVLSEPGGRAMLGTWNHFDYGKEKPPEDFLYRYDLDPFTGLDRTDFLSGKETDAMKQRLCSVQPGSTALARGQDSALCQQTVHSRPERRPVTTPPANNQGRSVPPGSRPPRTPK